MLAIIPVRIGVAPLGAAEVAAEVASGPTSGGVVVVGSGAAAVATELLVYSGSVRFLEHPVELHRLASSLVSVITAGASQPLLLPGSPDGRDLAPLLALHLGWPLYAGATEVRHDRVRLARDASTSIEEIVPTGPFVATLIPGVRGSTTVAAKASTGGHQAAKPKELKVPISADPAAALSDAVSLEVLPPDAATMDLGEAKRILGGGAGLNDERCFTQLGAVAGALDASMGATRVITDHGWVGHERQIGTTGVVVDPDLYVAFGISGAVQHTSGLGHPDHIICVNTDEHCPMMQLADLAIVADANATLDELAGLLGLSRMNAPTARAEAS